MLPLGRSEREESIHLSGVGEIWRRVYGDGRSYVGEEGRRSGVLGIWDSEK